ncbi:MAG: D-alanine-D-alanine ligase [Thermotogota bacterium]|nr:D-alanine-D-alanine ligase [Thermotogota bacterium]MDK2865094.1 D-alanine-D-alanine ligase [Thermotogota bacterium]
MIVMRIGIAYDIRDVSAVSCEGPEDALEEYDLPETVEAISQVLSSMGYSVVKLGGGREFLQRILREEVDFVFNIAEGRGTYRSREAQVPAVLEMLGIPYSGSDPQTLAICLDKPLTKRLVKTAGVATPRWIVAESLNSRLINALKTFPLPAFVKPAYEGSSKGIRFSSKVGTIKELIAQVRFVLETYRQPALVEEFIPGDDVTVAVLDSPPRVTGIMRVLPKDGYDPDFVYSLEIKRDWNERIFYECPAQLPEFVEKRLRRDTLKSFSVLGCRDLSRFDFRISTEGIPYFLEVNPLPGMRPGYSDFVIIAERMGYSYSKLIELILESAFKRLKMKFFPRDEHYSNEEPLKCRVFDKRRL